MNIDSSEILITGGTGLLGSVIASILLGDGHRVKILTRNTSLKNSKNITYVYGDITNEKILQNALIGCNKIFHCAGEKTSKKEMIEVNVKGTKLLFDICKESDIKYFCFISSVGVIGQTNDLIVTENTKCCPMNLYEETKYEAEKIVSKGMPNCQTIILRPTNIFSAETFKNIHKLRSKFKYWFKGNENAHLVYCEDVANAAVFFSDKKLNNSADIFIISSDEEKGNTYKEIFSYINKMKDKNNFIKYSPPSFFPWFYRKIKHGVTNRGNIIYSSQKLINYGFKFPFGLYDGLKKSI